MGQVCGPTHRSRVVGLHGAAAARAHGQERFGVLRGPLGAVHLHQRAQDDAAAELAGAAAGAGAALSSMFAGQQRAKRILSL